LYGVICLWLAFASSAWQIVVAFAFYGIFYAIEDSQTKAMIADLEHDRRATAMGVYNAVTGVLYLPASLVAGALWAMAPAFAFGLAAVLSVLAILVFMGMRFGRQLASTRT
jgi:MFS family permease